MLDIEFYRPIVKFLSLYLGKETEIILCDTEKILLIENPMKKEHVSGAPLSEMLQTLIVNPEYKEIPYLINYRTLSSTGEKVRSATLFIREGNAVSGLLTINSNVGELVRIRTYLDSLISGNQQNNALPKDKKISKSPKSYESLTLSATEIIDSVLKESTIRFNVQPSRFTANEKLSTIREMDSRGVFLAKNSVNEVAEKLGSSKATIYRYLHQLEK